ncbi:hypothetical protein ACHAXS_009685 [Conticribra weissflogii]
MAQQTLDDDPNETFLVTTGLPLAEHGKNDDSVEAEGRRRPSRRQPSSLRHSRHMSSRINRINNYQLLSLEIAEECDSRDGTKSLSNLLELADDRSRKADDDCGAPIGEILVECDDDDDGALDDSLYFRSPARRCSDITTHSAFDGQSGDLLGSFNSSFRSSNSSKNNILLSSFTGGGSRWNDSISTSATDCPEELAKLAEQLNLYDVDSTLDSSINSYDVGAGINDSTNLGKPKGLLKNGISSKCNISESTNTITTVNSSVASFDPDNIETDWKELLCVKDSISSVQANAMLDNSLILAGGIQDSTTLDKAQSLSKLQDLSNLNGSSSSSIFLDHTDLPPQLLPKSPGEKRKRTFTHRTARRRGYTQDSA